jgi:hypothetical protein
MDHQGCKMFFGMDDVYKLLKVLKTNEKNAYK